MPLRISNNLTDFELNAEDGLYLYKAVKFAF